MLGGEAGVCSLVSGTLLSCWDSVSDVPADHWGVEVKARRVCLIAYVQLSTGGPLPSMLPREPKDSFFLI